MKDELKAMRDARMPQPGAQGLWAVAWRSIVFLPMMLGMFLLLLAHFSGFLLLPLVGGACIWDGRWPYGVASFSLWFLLLWSWRHFRLREHFQSPPSLL